MAQWEGVARRLSRSQEFQYPNTWARIATAAAQAAAANRQTTRPTFLPGDSCASGLFCAACGFADAEALAAGPTELYNTCFMCSAPLHAPIICQMVAQVKEGLCLCSPDCMEAYRELCLANDHDHSSESCEGGSASGANGHGHSLSQSPVASQSGIRGGNATKRFKPGYKLHQDSIAGITKAQIRRIAKRGGAKRLSGLVYDETRSVLKVFLEDTIRDAYVYADHARRKTVTAMDVVYALKRKGHTLLGYAQ